MGKSAYLDGYNYSFAYRDGEIYRIEIVLDRDDMVYVADISTEISMYEGNIYVEGLRFKHLYSSTTIEDDKIYFYIYVKEMIGENRLHKGR